MEVRKIMQVNSKKLTADFIGESLTRSNCYEAIIPYTAENFSLTFISTRKDTMTESDFAKNHSNVYEIKSIPSEKKLIELQNKLCEDKRLANDHEHVLTYDKGLLSYEDLCTMMKISSINKIKQRVAQEIKFFNTKKTIPCSINQEPDREGIELFKTHLWDFPMNPKSNTSNELKVTPTVLEKLCCTRWLDDTILSELCNVYNNQFPENRSLLFNRNSCFLKADLHKRTPKVTAFLANVSSEVINGSRRKTLPMMGTAMGNHWTCILYFADNNVIIYGDSEGSEIPANGYKKLIDIINDVWSPENEPRFIYAHDPDHHAKSKKINCTKSCFPYPLQTCGNVCGVVVAIMAAVAMANPMFILDMCSPNCSNRAHNSFLKHPTKYSPYLRVTLISWLTLRKVVIENVIAGNDAVDSDDDDLYHTPRVYNNESTSVELAGQSTKQSTTTPSTVKSELYSLCNDKVDCPEDFASHEDSDHLPKEVAKSVSCHMCNKTFGKQFTLNRHLKNVHKKSSNVSYNCVCMEGTTAHPCDFTTRLRSVLREHLRTIHGIILSEEIIELDNERAFNEWKSEYEQRTLCNYRVNSSQKLKNKLGHKVKYYQCGRSGTYKVHSNRRRSLKCSGTIKINSNCISALKVETLEDNKIRVNIYPNHYGHEIELEHVGLSSAERKSIAARLRSGVSVDKILDSIRDDVGYDNVKRQHLVDRQEIRNINRAFAIDLGTRCEDDQKSVAMLVNEWEGQSFNPVLFKKYQGESLENFEKDDFMLVLQTEFQQEMYINFAKNGVLADSTHGTNLYKFYLITLSIVDEYSEGVPTCWCIANHEDHRVLLTFFRSIVERCNAVEPTWFMSDMAPQFYDAFCLANQWDGDFLWCYWHVDKAWRENLQSKLNDRFLIADVYKRLKVLAEMTNVADFEVALKSFIDGLCGRDNLLAFGNYFRSGYVKTKKNWARCYRVGTGINTNMRMESFHKVLKYKYLGGSEGKRNQRLDKLLGALLKYNRDKIYDRMIKSTKGKATYALRQISTRHKNSLRMDFSAIDVEPGVGWYVQSEQNPKKNYLVQVLSDDKCVDEKCFCRCKECGVCSHMYKCQCFDFLNTCLPCKHIHLVHRNNCDTIDVSIATTQDARSEILLKSFEFVKAPLNSADNWKRQVLADLNELRDRIESESHLCPESMDALSQLTSQIRRSKKTYLACLDNKSVVEEFDAPPKVKGDNKLVKQPTFKCTKAKRKVKNSSMCKPTSAETDFFLDPKNLADFEDICSSHDKRCKVEDEELHYLNLSIEDFFDIFGLKKPVKGKKITGGLVKIKKFKFDHLKKYPDVVKDNVHNVRAFFTSDGWSRLNSCAELLVKQCRILDALGLQFIQGKIFKEDDCRNVNLSLSIIKESEEDFESVRSLFDASVWPTIKQLFVDNISSMTCELCSDMKLSTIIECEGCAKKFHWSCVEPNKPITSIQGHNWKCVSCFSGNILTKSGLTLS